MFERAPYVVLGQTDYDQNWIDGNVAAGVAACKWQPPAARPESLRPQKTVAATIMVKRKPSLRKRIKARIWPAKTEPVVPVPPMPARQPAVIVEPDIIVRPVDPVDDLLDVPASPTQPAPPVRKPRWFNR